MADDAGAHRAIPEIEVSGSAHRRGPLRPERLQSVRTRVSGAGLARLFQFGDATALALGWVMNNALVTGVIAGPRTLAQWQDYVAAMAFRFDAEDEAVLSALVPAGHPSTPGYTDPAYPLTGRQPLNGSRRA